MKKYFIVTIMLCYAVTTIAQPQTAALHSQLTKSQKEYINTHIDQKERSKYLSLVHFGNIYISKVFEEIQRMDAGFWTNANGVQFLVHFPTYGSLQGQIWKDSSVCYNFMLGADKKLQVYAISVTELAIPAKAIVEHFSNWSHPIFSKHGAQLAAPTDHPFYLASRYDDGVMSTLGFYVF